MNVEWFNPRAGTETELFGQTSNILKNLNGPVARVVSSVVGARGADGGNVIEVMLFANVSGHKAVTYSGVPADSSTLASYAGVTLGAGLTGTSAIVQKFGILEDSSFEFIAGDAIFIGPNGSLIQQANAPLRRIGRAITSTKIELCPMLVIED